MCFSASFPSTQVMIDLSVFFLKVSLTKISGFQKSYMIRIFPTLCDIIPDRSTGFQTFHTTARVFIKIFIIIWSFRMFLTCFILFFSQTIENKKFLPLQYNSLHRVSLFIFCCIVNGNPAS